MPPREFIKNKYILVSKLIKPNSKILDIGCNKAEIKEFLSNVNYFGLDINKSVINDLKKQGFNVFYADLNKNIKIKGKFDYILLLDILEHVVDPKLLIENSKKLLNNNGFIIISLPNDYHFFNKFRFIFNKEISPPFILGGHLHIFPIRSGRELIEANNLVILKKFYLAPIIKLFPKFLINILARISPNNFVRNVIYLTKINN